jgi:hypothetical protein
MTDLILLNPAHSYRRAPPALATCWSPDDDLLSYFYNNVRQRDVQCPDETMQHFDRAFVYEGQFVLTTGQEWLEPSIADYPPASQVVPVLRQTIAEGRVHHLPYNGKPTVVIAKAGSRNYGHTLAEIMPKLINIGRSPLRDIRLLLPEGMDVFLPVMQMVLDHLGVQVEWVFDPPARLTEVGNLFYIGPVSQHNTRKSHTLLVLRDLIQSILGITPAPSRRLFIDRRSTDSRSLANTAEVHAVVQARGYEVVYPGGMTLADQAALFSQASHIAGPLGAGLTNTLLAPSSCRVMMIDPGLADYFFWDLAALAGQPFTWMFAGPVTHFNQTLASSRYTVNSEALGYMLDRFD